MLKIKKNTVKDTLKIRGLKNSFPKSVRCAWVVCTRACLDYARAKITRALRLRADTIAMNCVPRDNLARPTRKPACCKQLQLVIIKGLNTPTLSTNRSRETVWGIYELLIKTQLDLFKDRLASSVGV